MIIDQIKLISSLLILLAYRNHWLPLAQLIVIIIIITGSIS